MFSFLPSFTYDYFIIVALRVFSASVTVLTVRILFIVYNRTIILVTR